MHLQGPGEDDTDLGGIVTIIIIIVVILILSY